MVVLSLLKMDGWVNVVLHYQRLHNETPLLLDQLGNTVDQYNQEIQLEIQNETRLFDPPIQFTLSHIFITIHATYRFSLKNWILI